jgi:AcrR family transcriptional regulator
VPTGVALRDVRQQLFDAAERVLLRDGANSLTSRAVTTEAGVAKGVLHKHFADFDDFLAELVLDRLGRIERQSAQLRAAAGTGTVAGNLTTVLVELFGSVAGAVVGLIIFRDELRARLRAAGLVGVPVLGEAARMISAYLTTEKTLGRVAGHADTDTLALTIIGSGHMLYAERDGRPPEAANVHKVVSTVLASVVR